jgi:GTPase SAR1 family protein
MHKTLIVKVVIIGDTTTGKTSIVHRYVKNKFYENSRPTIGVEFFNKDVFVEDPQIMPNTNKMVPNSGKSPILGFFLFQNLNFIL